MGLPRNRRLRGAEVGKVLRSGMKAVGPLAVLYWHPGGANGPARAAVVTGRRLGGAVDRNRLRRLFKEALRRRMEWIKADTQLVLVVRSRAGGSSFAGVAQAVDQLLTRAGLVSSGETVPKGQQEEISP